MANSFGTETPPAPDPDVSNALMSGAPSVAPNALTVAPAGPSASPAGAQPAPPTHEQTITALRHFDAIRKELQIILADPALGKSSVKSRIIDGMTRLVSARFLKPAEAVTELAKVPQEPLMQLKWAKGMLLQAQNAENSILDHYGMTNPNFATVGDHFAATQGMGNPDDHGDHMAALVANYKGAQANG
jgi:hypothetical protein